MRKKEVPPSLRIWFIIHFVVDFIVAIPLFIAPAWLLTLFGFGVVEPLTARLVAAALFGIGGTSLLMHKKSVDAFKTMIDLKLVWSVTAIAGMSWSILADVAPTSSWIFVALFFCFFLVWAYYKQQLG